MEEFDLEKWNYQLFRDQELAQKEIDKNNLIGDEIVDIITLEKDELHDKYFLCHEVLNHLNRKFEKHSVEKITLDMFPKNYKTSLFISLKSPIIFKLKSGKHLELYFREHFEDNNGLLTWTREALFSFDKLKEYHNKKIASYDYNKLFNFILNKKIIEINFDSVTKYFKHNKDSYKPSKDVLNINIIFENDYVLSLSRSGPDNGFFVSVLDLKKGTFDILSLKDIYDCYLGDKSDLEEPFPVYKNN